MLITGFQEAFRFGINCRVGVGAVVYMVWLNMELIWGMF
jgi:hypothetical protein